MIGAFQDIFHQVQNRYRITGILLVSSFIVPLFALIVLITSGAFPSFSAGLQGSLVEKVPYKATFRLLNLLWTAGWILQLMGYGLLTHLLLSDSDDYLAVAAFMNILIAAIIGVLHGTLHMSVETWVSLQAARTGFIPQAYEPLRILIGSVFQIAYVLALLGATDFGWSLLRTRLVPTWIGQATVAWRILWLAIFLIGVGLPGILPIIPAVIGVVILVDSRGKSV